MSCGAMAEASYRYYYNGGLDGDRLVLSLPLDDSNSNSRYPGGLPHIHWHIKRPSAMKGKGTTIRKCK